MERKEVFYHWKQAFSASNLNPGKKQMQIIGLAKGYAEALELVCSIIEEVYQNTGDVDVKSYLRGRKRRRQV